MSGTTQTALSLSDLPVGTQTVLSAGLLIPVNDPNGGGAGVKKTVRLDSGLFMASSVTYSGTMLGTLALNPAQFSYLDGTISLSSSGSTQSASGLSLNGTAISSVALDPSFFTLSNGTLTLLAEESSSLGTAGSLTGAMQQIVLDAGTPKLATLAQLAAAEERITQPAINLAAIGAQVTGQPFPVTATLANYLAAPMLYYADDSGALGPLPTGSTVTSSSVTFTHPGLGTGSHTLLLEDGEGNNAVSAAFAVATAPPTAATLSSVPSGATVGQPISGIMVSLTPSYATAYAALNTGGVDQGARQVFTGAAVPSLTPTGPGAYEVAIYAAATGGTAVTVSSTITVAAEAATGATLANVPSTATTGVPISGVTDTLTPTGAGAYAVLHTGGADEGTRQAFSGTSAPAIAPAGVGAYTYRIYAAATGGSALAESAAITVTAVATSATLANVPASGTKGQPITGMTDTLTPSYATAYAALYVNGADEGTRQAFTGTSVPSLTPQGGGNYLAKLYAALSGGTALATSAVIAVAVPATAASLAGVPSTGTVGTAISGITLSLTPANATAYMVVTANGTPGARVAVTAGALPSFTPSATGTDTIQIYAGASGGSALVTSSNITISGAAAPKVAGTVSPMLVLDASSSGAVTSDAALATPQTTNNGAVLGWKDGSGSGYNLTQTTAGNAASFVANSQNGLPGVAFPSGTGVLNGTSALAAALQAAGFNGGAGCTIALVFKYSALPSSYTLLMAQKPGASYFADGFGYSTLNATVHNNTAGGYDNAVDNSPPAAGTLVKQIITLQPSTGTLNSYVNSAAGANATYNQTDPDTYSQFQLGDTGLTAGDPVFTVYELDVWPGLASGTGGASPTGDIAAIMTYLTNKWGS